MDTRRPSEVKCATDGQNSLTKSNFYISSASARLFLSHSAKRYSAPILSFATGLGDDNYQAAAGTNERSSGMSGTAFILSHSAAQEIGSDKSEGTIATIERS